MALPHVATETARLNTVPADLLSKGSLNINVLPKHWSGGNIASKLFNARDAQAPLGTTNTFLTFSQSASEAGAARTGAAPRVQLDLKNVTTFSLRFVLHVFHGLHILHVA